MIRTDQSKSGRPAFTVDALLSGNARSHARCARVIRNLAMVLGMVEMRLAYVCLIHVDNAQ